MTKDEALKLALSTLDEVRSETFRLLRNGQKLYAENKVWDTVFAIKEVLAQPEQEPVAWMTITPYGEEDDIWYENPEGKLLDDWTYKPLYTTPPQPEPVIDKSAAVRIATSLGWEPKRTWVGLTDGEVLDIGMKMFADSKSPGSDPTIKQFNKIARAIESALRSKNT